MPSEHMIVGVVVERRKLDNPWVDHAWAPVAVLPDAPEIAPWTSLGAGDGAERFYLGAAELSLYSPDTASLIENFTDGAAKLWVSIRPTSLDPPVEIVGVTADPSEGEGFCDGVGDIVDVVPMPALIRERVIAFYNIHHVERPFVKRQRDKASREAMSHRPGGRAGRDEG
jgi:hypothetical protein